MLNLFKSIKKKKFNKFKKLNESFMEKIKECNIEEFEYYFYNPYNLKIVNKFIERINEGNNRIVSDDLCYVYLINYYCHNIFTTIDMINLTPYIKLTNKIISYIFNLDFNNINDCKKLFDKIIEFNGLICFYTLKNSNYKYHKYINNTLNKIEKSINNFYDTLNFTELEPLELYNEQVLYIDELYMLGKYGAIMYSIKYLRNNNIYNLLSEEIKKKFKDYLLK